MLSFPRFRLSACALLLCSQALLLPAHAASDPQTLRIALAQEAGSLDLLQNQSALSSYGLVFEPLIRYGSGGQLEPGLAEKWELSADGKSITFQLRQNVSFSDGTPFDAKAAAWNLERWMGKPDFSWIGISDNFQKLEVTGTHSLRIDLKAPVSVALAELTIVRPVRFLSPKAVDANGVQNAAIGTGPWKVVENTNSKTVLERNDQYWGTKPAFTKLELSVVPDELSRVNALKAGDLDVIGGEWVAPLLPARAKSLSSASDVGVFAAPGVSTLLLGFNNKRGPLAEANVRRAISLGISRAAVAKVLFQGYADPASNLFPPTIPYSGKRLPVSERNVAEANKLLDEAGWVKSGNTRSKGGQELVLTMLASDQVFPGARRLSELVMGQLSELGIGLKIASLDDATYHDRRQKFDYDLALFGTYAAPYDPHGTLSSMFVSTADSGPDGKIFVDKELDALIQAAMATSGSEREVAMQKVYDWMEANAAICPLVYPQRLWAYNKRLSGFALPPTEYDMPIGGLKVAQ